MRLRGRNWRLTTPASVVLALALAAILWAAIGVVAFGIYKLV